MASDEIMRLAESAGFDVDDGTIYGGDGFRRVTDEVHRFAELVAAAERDRCAKLATEYATWGGSNFHDWFMKLAEQIRSGPQQSANVARMEVCGKYIETMFEEPSNG